MFDIVCWAFNALTKRKNISCAYTFLNSNYNFTTIWNPWFYYHSSHCRQKYFINFSFSSISVVLRKILVACSIWSRWANIIPGPSLWRFGRHRSFCMNGSLRHRSIVRLILRKKRTNLINIMHCSFHCLLIQSFPLTDQKTFWWNASRNHHCHIYLSTLPRIGNTSHLVLCAIYAFHGILGY